MGTQRNGARTFLNVVNKACKLSHTPGFRTGIAGILAAADAEEVLALWDPFCAAVEALIAADNWFNQLDTAEEVPGSEDDPAGGPA